MGIALDREFAKLNKIIKKYCRKGKEEEVIDAVTWAESYADDYPQKADIEEAVELVRKVEKYIVIEGKQEYKQVRDGVIKRLLGLLSKKSAYKEDEED